MNNRNEIENTYVILKNDKNEKYIYSRKYKILIPFDQIFIRYSNKDNDIPSQYKLIFLNGLYWNTKLPDKDCAVDIFQNLRMLKECNEWKINQRFWKLSQPEQVYYKGKIRNSTNVTSYMLRCIYLQDRFVFTKDNADEIVWQKLGLSIVEEENNNKISDAKHKDEELKETKNILKQKGNGKNMQNPKEDDYVILKDKENEKYIYSKKYKILIPFKQDFSKCYEPDDKMATKSIFLGGFYWDTKLPNEYCAVDIFQNLAMLKECNYWKINERVWKLSTTNWVYDKGKLKSDNKEKVFLLRCIYLQDKYVFYEDTKDEIVWIKLGLSPVKEDNAGVLNLKPEVQQENKTNNTSKANKYSPDIDKLLKCDYNRCQLAPYEHGILFDIKKGHWDIYGLENIKSKYKREDMVGRDPRKDIKKEGVVGIDFGTKSTVVAIQDGTNRIVPVRIGTGKLKDQIKASDYENPTIIECNDLQSFLKAYEGKQGRPETSCDDFFISYYAYSDYCVCPPKEFYAYYSDIKQWSDGKKGDVIVQDKKNKIYKFSTESSMKKECINPIELYAYYIGMYINNMRNGIYMKYLLSYPVGYSKETRELILKSFEKGIKKSFPAAVLEDAGCMKNFSVKLGISEPAAYAVTALELSGLDPKDENESYMYGIFDFGGGTTDFDFGSWRGASEEEYEVEGYDYVLECFGADSDKTLGGENILEMLAYTVFKDNTGIARDKRLVCSLPVDENAFLGSEMLISDSQIAMRNMSILKEELRPLWHQEEGWEEKYKLAGEETDSDKGLLEITLYNTDGEKIPNCKLSVDVNKLLDLIKARIKKGIDAFFRCLERTFKYSERAREENRKVYIFLAGNSCKSKFVKEIFEGNIQEYYETFKKMRPDAGKSYFELIEPLEDKPDGLSYIPNGKTSVAYGLVKSRAGSTIKIVKNYETNSDEETRFKYYLGRERRRTFDCKLSPAKTEYNEWVQFQGSVKPVIRIYYTTNPMADSERDKLNIEDIKYKEIEIQPEKGKFLFIRTVKPAVIEYVVACDIEDISSDTIAGQIDLDI